MLFTLHKQLAITSLALILSVAQLDAESLTGYATYYTVASCQREGTSGTLTASGQPYRERAMTCAMRRKDFGKWYRVTCQKTGRSVLVKHTDYGPGRHASKRHGVVVDLTPAAWRKLGLPYSRGRAKIRIEPARNRFGSQTDATPGKGPGPGTSRDKPDVTKRSDSACGQSAAFMIFDTAAVWCPNSPGNLLTCRRPCQKAKAQK